MNTETPTGEDLFLLMLRNNLTQAQTAQILGVTDRTIRRWLRPDDRAGHRKIPPAAWYMLTAECEKLEKGVKK